jgi:predicted DNA-binding transcriptional regulator AlpA
MRRDADERTPAPPAITPILLASADAAAALGISPRMLWAITAPRGDLPSVRLGPKCVRYRAKDLEAWAAAKAAECEAKV